MKKWLCLFLISFVWATSCRRAEPSIDWSDFDPTHIDDDLSQRGPLGNYRVVFTQNKIGAYGEKELIKFARSNGWNLLKTEKEDTQLMSMAHHLYDEMLGDKENTLPSWFNNSKNTYYSFSVRFKTDKGKEESLNTSVLVSADESAMCAYNVKFYGK